MIKLEYNNFYFNNLTSSCFLIEGDDDLLKNLAIKKIKKQYNIEDLDCLELYEDITPSLIQSSAEPIPFFSDKRLVIVHEYYPKTKEFKELEKVLSDNENSSSIILFCNNNKFDAIKKLDNVVFVDCNKCESFLKTYVKELFNKENIKTNDLVVNTIIEFCSCEAFKVEAECKKLIGYALKKGEVTLDDVTNLVNKDLDYKIYELTDYIAKKQQQKAYEIINDMINKGEPEHKIFVSIYNHFKRLFYCRLNTDARDLADILGIKEFAVKKAIETSKRFTAVKLKEITQRFSDYDFSVKSGNIDIKNALWLSIFQIAI